MDPNVVKMKEENGALINKNVLYRMNLVVQANQNFGVTIQLHVILMDLNAVNKKMVSGVLI